MVSRGTSPTGGERAHLRKLQTKGARASCPLRGACGRDAHAPFNKRLCNFRDAPPPAADGKFYLAKLSLLDRYWPLEKRDEKSLPGGTDAVPGFQSQS